MITQTLVINDLHRPFHDPRSVNLVLDIAKDIDADRIVLNGDVMDMYNVNSHSPTHPLVGTLLSDEIADTRMWLRSLRDEFPTTEIIYVFGNHEDRLERFLIQHAKALFGIVDLVSLLGLEDLDITYIPYNARYRLEKSNVFCQHSPPSYAKNGAMTSLERDIDESTIYGCSHREQKAVKSAKSGKQYYCYFNGWLGSTSKTKEHKRVFSYVKGHENWQQCFCVVTIENGKDAYINQVSIQDNKCVYEGNLYEA